MIPEWEANRLFVSDRLGVEFPAVLDGLRAAFGELTVSVLPGTRDIWCRDYMPVQVGERSFCRFAYRPDYLRGYEHLVTPPAVCRLPFMRTCRSERVVLDGGNVVASRAQVILTDKVFAENPTRARQRLLRRLEQVFAAECVVIPRQRGDAVGHADGVVRFLAEGRVVMNDYSATDPEYGEAVATILRDAGLEVETLPYFEDECAPPAGELPSAAGVYVNYARVGDFVALPAFGRPEDESALRKLRQLLPGARVVPVPCRELADEGGVLNCVTWVARA